VNVSKLVLNLVAALYATLLSAVCFQELKLIDLHFIFLLATSLSLRLGRPIFLLQSSILCTWLTHLMGSFLQECQPCLASCHFLVLFHS